MKVPIKKIIKKLDSLTFSDDESSSVDLVLAKIKNILEKDMSDNVDERIKDIYLDDIHIFGFDAGDSKYSDAYGDLSECICSIGDTLYENNGVNLYSCAFGWDSHSQFLICGSKNKSSKIRDKVNKYIRDKIHPNGNMIYECE